MDDLDYFPTGARPTGYRPRPGYPNPGEAPPAGRHRGTEQSDGVWQRLATASGQPLGAPVDAQPDAPWLQRGPMDNRPRTVSPGNGYRPPAPPRRETPANGYRYAGSRPSPGYPTGPYSPPGPYNPPGAYSPPGAYNRSQAGLAQYPPYEAGPSYDQAVDDGLPYEDDDLPDAFAGRTTRPNGTRPNGTRPPRSRALTDTGSSLLGAYSAEAAPAETTRTMERPEARAGSAAAPAAGRAMPGWVPFGSRLVLLPKEDADSDDETREHRDVNGGALRPAVFGAMDGLVTNASLIAGVGGGGGAHGMIVLTGIAGLIAGAFSMATGEYISVKSQNELTQSEVDLERRQHARDSAGKLEKLTQTYIGKGVSPNLAEAVARQISSDPERAVAEHVREELGIDPDDLPSPRTAATASMLSFTVGALIPLLPFLVGFPVLQLALTLAGVSALAGGAVVARLTGRSALLGGLRQFSAAFAATGMSFLIGHLISAHVS